MRHVPSLPRLSAVAFAVIVLAGCGRNTREEAPFMGESFDSDDTYSRTYELPPAQACSAAR